MICMYQASKYLKIGTCPASQKILVYMGEIEFSIEISKFSLALQPEELVNTSGQLLFSSPVYPNYFDIIYYNTAIRSLYRHSVCNVPVSCKATKQQQHFYQEACFLPNFFLIGLNKCEKNLIAKCNYKNCLFWLIDS